MLDLKAENLGEKNCVKIYSLVKSLYFKLFCDFEELTQDFWVVRACSAEVYVDV